MLILIILVNSLNNAINYKKDKIIVKKINIVSLKILQILQSLNVIESFKVSETLDNCVIYLNTHLNQHYLSKILMISKPSRYIYYNFDELINLRSNDSFNDYILSINDKTMNIVTIDDAIRLHKGGLLLLKIFRTLK